MRQRAILTPSMLDEFEELPFPEGAWEPPWIAFGLEDDQSLAPQAL